MRKIIVTVLVLSIVALFHACEEEWFIDTIENNISFKSKLSEYHIYQSPLKNLAPDSSAFIYELNTPLFTDYASKQRVIKLPEGQKLDILNTSALDYPEGSIIAKTFYYDASQLPSSAVKKVLETRLLIYRNGKWNVGVYKWNDGQTEAYLIEDGASVSMQQVLPNGKTEHFTYEIPSNSECTTCHNSNNRVRPIGPKLASLNIPHWQGSNESQLKAWIDNGFLKQNSLNNLPELPQWDKSTFTISQRARAYLDVNCAHCHNPSGVASDWSLDLRYTTPFNQTGIDPLRFHIPERMESDWDDEVMPKIGTTLKHEEGIELIKAYVNQL